MAQIGLLVSQLKRLLIRLHRARIIELLPLNRVKLLTARNFTWRLKTVQFNCSAVFAIRPWEFSMFENLRRKPAGAR